MLTDYQVVLPVRTAFTTKKFTEMLRAFAAEQKMGKDMDRILQHPEQHPVRTARKELGEKTAEITYAKSGDLTGFMFSIASKTNGTSEQFNVILDEIHHEIFMSHNVGFSLTSSRSTDLLLDKYWFSRWMITRRYFGVNGIFTVGSQPVSLRFDDELSAVKMLRREVLLYVPVILLRCQGVVPPFSEDYSGEFTVMQEGDPALFPAAAEDFPDVAVPGKNTVTVIYPDREIETADCTMENITRYKNKIHQFMLSADYPTFSQFWVNVNATTINKDNVSVKKEVPSGKEPEKTEQKAVLVAHCKAAEGLPNFMNFQIPMRTLTGDDFPQELMPSFAAKIKEMDNCELVDIFYLDRLHHARTSVAKIGVPLLTLANSIDSMYTGEQRAVVTRALMNYRKQFVQKGTREAEVLDAVIAENYASDCVKPLNERRERINKIFNGFRSMTPQIQRELESMGFKVSTKGKHIKLTAPESKAICVCASTGSDINGGKNMAGQFNKSFH